jgi:hypothetical protein
MKKYQFSLFEDGGILAFLAGFIAISVWGVVDMMARPPRLWYQLPLFILFMVALCGVGIFALRQQMRLRVCPKCQTVMNRAPSRGDGFRRQKCPQCETVMKTARKNSLQAIDEIEAAASS